MRQETFKKFVDECLYAVYGEGTEPTENAAKLYQVIGEHTLEIMHRYANRPMQDGLPYSEWKERKGEIMKQREIENRALISIAATCVAEFNAKNREEDREQANSAWPEWRLREMQRNGEPLPNNPTII